MAQIQAEIIRVYIANSCSKKVDDNFLWQFNLKDFKIFARAATKLRLPIQTVTFGTPTSKAGANVQKESKQKPQTFPDPNIFPADFYVEIYVSVVLKVTEDLFLAFNKHDIEVRTKLFEMIKHRKDDYNKGMDLVAGLIGLRLNKLLVNSFIDEQIYLFYDKSKFAINSNTQITVTDSYEIPEDKDYLKQRLRPPTNIVQASKTFPWLLRAWGAKDQITKFLSYLIALETVIPRLKNTDIEFREKADRIIALITTHSEESDSILVDWFNSNVDKSVPLITRFHKWAENIDKDNFADDLATFRKYNKIRNGLLHTGNPASSDKITKELLNLQKLELLCEKYICYSIFGDTHVYKRSV